MSTTDYKNLTFRKADPEDSVTIYDFICKLEQKEMDYETFKSRFRQQIISPLILFILAEDAGIPIGFLSCHNQNLLHHNGTVFEIVELVVDEAVRGKGVGKKMVQYLEEQLKDIDYELIEVASNNQRTQAHHFYQKCGFKPTHFKFTKHKAV